jgi:hypothetical protein
MLCCKTAAYILSKKVEVRRIDLGQILQLCFPEVLGTDLEECKTFPNEMWVLSLVTAVTYLQHSRAGISLYGFVLDRTFLYSMSGVTVSLTLFILGKTIFA